MGRKCVGMNKPGQIFYRPTDSEQEGWYGIYCFENRIVNHIAMKKFSYRIGILSLLFVLITGFSNQELNYSLS